MALSILIAEDDELIRNKLKRYLDKTEHSLSLAGNGRQAIDILKTEVIDVLLTDIYMPDMDGYELILFTRKSYPEVNIMAMSGGSQAIGLTETITLDTARAMGVTCVLAKPVSREDLLSALEAV